MRAPQSQRLGVSGAATTPMVVSAAVNQRACSASQAPPSSLRFATIKRGPHAPMEPAVIRGEKCWPLGSRFPGGMAEVVSALSARGPADVPADLVSGESVPTSSVSLCAPVPRPPSVIGVGKNYLDHVKEMDKSLPTISKPSAPAHAIIFTKAPTSVIGPADPLVYPEGVSSEVDYEGELGVVIGKGGRFIPRERAFEHVFGYTIVNDVSARDLQKRHQQFFLAKSVDGFCPMGPWIVPAAELDVRSRPLRIRTWVNGELRQDGTTDLMIWDIPALIEVVSKSVPLQPGDVIATGTPAGVGAGFTPPKFLRPGDVVRVEIDGIGELSTTVVPAPPAAAAAAAAVSRL